MTEHTLSILSWDPLGYASCDKQGNITFFSSAQAQTEDDEQPQLLPEVAEGTAASCIYIPLEQLLTRRFYFPLKQPRFLDADMLGQELADTAGINPEEWWLSWRAEQSDNGIAGIAFGLPQSIQHAIQASPEWHQSPQLLIDGWERLHQWLTSIAMDETVIIIDADAEGVFFGLRHQGSWQGMRRLNGDMQQKSSVEAMVQQISWSLQSMGMVAAETHVTGRLTPDLATSFSLFHPAVPPQVEAELPARHILNLALPNPVTAANTKNPHHFNIRHGQWATKHSSGSKQAWYRPALLAVCLSFLWLGMTSISNNQLEHQLSNMNDALTEAFHRGLPDQPVIIDALAQLRQAANSSNTKQGNTFQPIEQLGHISAVFSQSPWQMQDIKISNASIFIAGKVKSLAYLNTIHNALEQQTSSTVQITDTDLKGNEVSFRMRWK